MIVDVDYDDDQQQAAAVVGADSIAGARSCRIIAAMMKIGVSCSSVRVTAATGTTSTAPASLLPTTTTLPATTARAPPTVTITAPAPAPATALPSAPPESVKAPEIHEEARGMGHLSWWSWVCTVVLGDGLGSMEEMKRWRNLFVAWARSVRGRPYCRYVVADLVWLFLGFVLLFCWATPIFLLAQVCRSVYVDFWVPFRAEEDPEEKPEKDAAAASAAIVGLTFCVAVAILADSRVRAPADQHDQDENGVQDIVPEGVPG